MKKAPTMKARPGRVARKEYTQYQVIYTICPRDHHFCGSPRQTSGFLPAVLRQQLLQQSSVKRKRRKLLVPSPASRGPSPPVAAAPGPFPLTAPGTLASRVPSRTVRPGPGFLRPRRPHGAPEGGDGPGRGRGAPGPQAPRAAARPLPAPQLSRLPHLNSSRPPSSFCPLQPLPGGGCGRYFSPRLGPWARPRRAWGASEAVSRAQDGGWRGGGAAAASGWGPSPASWGLRSPLPSLGSPGSRLSAADCRHLGEGEKSASGQGASVEPRAQTQAPEGESRSTKSVEHIE
uniref:translation initiation factor IF-2-like n=1 Tax=Callithrix jacchus TaxID=9483 RepID=UPI0023DD1C7B|nr:translation initiation factor IF-2-like [Callithrix jacchus]